MRHLALSLLLMLLAASGAAAQWAIDSLALYHEATYLNSGKIQQEMIYLHLDNTSYFRGDRIHFACYLVTSGRLHPSRMSHTVYVELVNPGGKVVDRCVLHARGGRCHGSLLADESPFYSGYYEIRAYTRYMLNFGPEAIYSRVIPIFAEPATEGDYSDRRMRPYGSAKLQFARPKPERGSKADAAFYPEGGRLVAGLPATVAFELTGPLREPLQASGRVVDRSTDSLVATFAADTMGRGTFRFTPRARGRYRAEFTTADGKRHRSDLPDVAPAGIALRVDNRHGSDSVTATVARTAHSGTGMLGVTLTCRGALCGRAILDLTSEPEATLTLARSSLPTGVIQLTVFDTGGSPLADRLFFNRRDDSFIHTDIHFDRSAYGSCDPVELEVRLSAADGSPRSVPFSLSVADADEHVWSGRNILTDMLLASEVRGYLHNPAYYFADPADSLRHQALDHLLMVQGWRRYSWRQLAGLEPYRVDSLPEVGVEVKGHVIGSMRGKPKAGVTVSAMLTPLDTVASGSAEVLVDTYVTDSLGRFLFRTDAVGDYMMTLSTSEKGKLAAHRLMLDRMGQPAARRYHSGEMQVTLDADIVTPPVTSDSVVADDAAELDSLEQLSRGHMLKELEVTAKSDDGTPNIGRLRDKARVRYDVEVVRDALVDRGKRFVRTLVDLLPLIDLNFKHVWAGDHDSLTYRGKAPLYVIDYGLNSQVYDPPEVGRPYALTVPVETVKSVYVNEDLGTIMEYARKFMAENHTADMSIIDVERKFGCVVFVELYPRVHVKMRRGMRRTTLRGYSPVEEFYTPDYSSTPAIPTDYRRTIHWDPRVMPDADGVARVRFFNSSTATSFVVTTAVLAPDGTLGGR